MGAFRDKGFWLASPLVGIVLAGCGSASSGPSWPRVFDVSDCTTTLHEIGRFPGYGQPFTLRHVGLAASNGTVYFAHSASPGCKAAGSCDSGGIAALPVTGGTPREVAVGYSTAFWVDGDTLLATSGGAARTVSLSSASPAQIPNLPGEAQYEAETVDATYVYMAWIDGTGNFAVTRADRATGEGAKTLYADTRTDGVYAIADAGDALLVSVSWSGANHLLRVPKDGGATVEPRPDLQMGVPSFAPDGWIGWTGSAVATHLDTSNGPSAALFSLKSGPPTYLSAAAWVQASAPAPGGVRLLSMVVNEDGGHTTSRLMLQSVDSSGAHVLGCTPEADSAPTAVGVAVGASGTYVAYWVASPLVDTTAAWVIARAP